MSDNTSLLNELRRMARDTDDAIKANKAGTAAHKVEYEAICADPNTVDHERLRELFPYMVLWPQDARRLERERDALLAAVEVIELLTKKEPIS